MKDKIVLVYPAYDGPPLGPPLSLLSLASPLLEAGFRVRILDGSVDPVRKMLETEIADALCVGISFLTGPMIRGAIALSRVVRRLPDRLIGSNNWIEYNGISNHKKLLDSNANFEEFEVDNPEKHLHIKAQTLRLYNPETHQWSIYLLDLDKGLLPMPPVVGEFSGNRGEFYDQEQYKGRAIFVRYVWLNVSPKSARMEQSFSADGGKTWETNWICELSR